MRLDSSGNLGIGTTSPSTLLDVDGAATFAGDVNTGPVLTVTGTEGVSANLYLIADDGDDNGDGWRLSSNQDVNDLTFANNTSGSYVDKLTITTAGNATFAGLMKSSSAQVETASTGTNNLYGGNSYFGGTGDSSGNANASILNTGAAEFTSIAAPNVCKAWINFDGTGTVSTRDHFNVASLTDHDTGDYTITFTNALGNANYAVGGSVGTTGSTGASDLVLVGGRQTAYGTLRSTTAARFGSTNTGGSSEDGAIVSVLIFGD